MLIALVPNVIPLIMLAAILGFFGIQLKVSTAIIFTISFGIAVDDTIHFMSKLKLELNKGQSLLYAIKRTYISTGKAIILTTLILCSGFLLLIFSDFLGTFYVGVLISLTLFFALLPIYFYFQYFYYCFTKFRQKKNLLRRRQNRLIQRSHQTGNWIKIYRRFVIRRAFVQKVKLRKIAGSKFWVIGAFLFKLGF